jgi:hypothetical protein
MTEANRARIVLVPCVAAIIIGSVGGIAMQRGLTWDFANFYVAGQKALFGQFGDLYDVKALVGGSEPLSDMPFFSLPATSFFYLPLALFRPEVSLVLFTTFSALCTWAGLWALYQHMRSFAAPGDPAFAGLFALAALGFQPFWTIFLVGGQTMPLVFLLMVLGLVWFTAARMAAAAAAGVLVVLIKPVFLPGLALLFLFGGHRFRLWAAGLSAAAAAVSFALVGWEPHLAFLRQMADAAAAVEKVFFISHMFAWLEPLFVSVAEYESRAPVPGDLTAARLVVRLLLIWLFVRAYLPFFRSAAPEAGKRHLLFVLSLILPLVLSPIVWEHYLVLLFVPLAQMIAARRHFPRVVQGLLVLTVLSCAVQNIWVVQKLERAFGIDIWAEAFALALAKSVTMALVVAVMLVWRREYLRSYAAAGGLSATLRSIPG